MKISPFVLIGLAAVAVVALTTNSASAAPAQASDFNLSSLSDQYGSENVQDLQNLLNELATRGLTDQQILFMLSQALQETGLFTDNPNYNAVETKNNFSGISNSDGSITSFNSISDFVDDWVQILTKGADPLAATSVNDFNSRLYNNGYYAHTSGYSMANDPAFSVYGNNLNTYYNILTGIM